MIVQCLLKKVHRNAGLGDPPSPYFNNSPESSNALIKRAVHFKVSEMTEFCRSISMLVLQIKDVESAVLTLAHTNCAQNFRRFYFIRKQAVNCTKRWWKVRKKATCDEYYGSSCSGLSKPYVNSRASNSSGCTSYPSVKFINGSHGSRTSAVSSASANSRNGTFHVDSFFFSTP